MALSVEVAEWSPGAMRITESQNPRYWLEQREVPVTRSWTSLPLTLLATRRRRSERHRQVGSHRTRKPVNTFSTLLLSHWRSKVRRGEPQLQGTGHPVLFKAWWAQQDKALPYGT